MSDVATVKRAVRALAENPPERRAPPPVVADAGTALADVRRAARFVADGGESRLREAVGEAERRGDLETVREGRRALAALSRLRDRARDDRARDDRARDDRAADHFHPARGTVLGGGGQCPER